MNEPKHKPDISIPLGEYLLENTAIRRNIASHFTQGAQEPQTTPFPAYLRAELLQYCIKKGINNLYSHQAKALDHIHQNRNVVITTGTSSGKSLIYQLAIFQQWLEDADSTALMLYPTKALENDQVRPLQEMQAVCSGDSEVWSLFSSIYDGDTSKQSRKAIRNNAQILLTNPDMLHMSLLPHHTLWKRFFSNLRYVVIDEVHVYKGVFGSHFANLMRRLKRILEFYHADPQFILTSATIHDPKEFAQKLIEEEFISIERDGSARGEKELIFYNPPLVDPALGVRKGIIDEGLNILHKLMERNVQTIAFVRARQTVEIVLRRSKEKYGDSSLSGYRSGYLAQERRSIEKGLKDGSLRSVVATNALELGVDIGGMDCVLLLGYPGTIAAFLQQIGRAGRTGDPSAAIFVASMDPLDQFILINPAFILDNNPEQPLINPDNVLLLFNQLRCAAYEKPFAQGESFGSVPPAMVEQYLQVLSAKGDLIQQGEQYFWIGEQYPSADISIRSISASPYDLYEMNEGGKLRKVGEVDGESAFWMVHPGAIYLHSGESYLVEDLHMETHKVILRKGEFDYYTKPKQEMEIAIDSTLTQKGDAKAAYHFGDVTVTSQVVGFDQIDWKTYEVIRSSEISLPSSDLATQACWLTFSEKTINALRKEQLWGSDRNDYGKDWELIRKKILDRDGYRCALCGKVDVNGSQLHVHHKQPLRTFTNRFRANHPSNLVTLCDSCHRRVEQTVRVRSALSGLGYIVSHMAPLYLMCDIRDTGVYIEPRWKEIGNMPVIMLYDNFPGGIGLSETLYEKYQDILENAQKVITGCACSAGCPSCVGPVNQELFDHKKATLALIHEIIG